MRKSDNLMAWRAFITTAETGAVSRAAQILGVDAPTVSHLISDLEDDLGYKLLDRSVRPFVLTDKGHYLADTVAPLEQGFREAVDYFDNDNRSVLTIAAPTDLNQCYLHDQLFHYSMEHPRVQFYLKSSCPVADVLSGRVDAAFTERPAVATNLVVRFVLQAPAYPMASRRYIEKNGYPRVPEDLKNHTGLLLRQGMHKMTSFLYKEKTGESQVLKWKHIFMTDAQLTLNHMLLDDMGIVIDCVPQHLIKELESGEVVPVLPGWRRKPQELCIVTRRDREASSDDLHDFVMWWKDQEKKAGGERVQRAQALYKSVMARYEAV